MTEIEQKSEKKNTTCTNVFVQVYVFEVQSQNMLIKNFSVIMKTKKCFPHGLKDKNC